MPPGSSRRDMSASAGVSQRSVLGLDQQELPAMVEPVMERASWYRSLKSIGDLFISVELTGAWYLHIVYAKKDGAELRNLFTQRFAALLTMLSLLVASQVGTMFSPSRPTEKARTALEQLHYQDVAFWAGLTLCISLIFSILSLLATLSAWALITSVGTKNIHTILRSSMCLSAATLPVRLAVVSIYIYFLWINLFWYVIADISVAIPLSSVCWAFGTYVVGTYSAIGRVIMYSGALGDEKIMEQDEEDEMTGVQLATALTEKAVVAKEGKIPVSQQYRIKYQEQLHILEEGGSLQLSDLLLPEYQSEHEEEDEDSSTLGLSASKED